MDDGRGEGDDDEKGLESVDAVVVDADDGVDPEDVEMDTSSSSSSSAFSEVSPEEVDEMCEDKSSEMETDAVSVLVPPLLVVVEGLRRGR